MNHEVLLNFSLTLKHLQQICNLARGTSFVTLLYMLQLFGYLSGLFPAIGYLLYFRDILKHKTKPERAGWLIWTILGTIAFFAQWSSGASNSLWLTVIETIGPLIVFLFALPYGLGGLSRLDIAALFFAAVGLLAWHFTNQPAVGLTIIILIDMIGTVLTAVKTYGQPDTETLSTWVLSSVGSVCGVLAAGKLSYGILAYPVYLFLGNFALVLIIILRRQRKAEAH